MGFRAMSQIEGLLTSPSWAIPSNTKHFTTRRAGILAGTLDFTVVANQDSQQLISLRRGVISN
jgi:hypothetical protein